MTIENNELYPDSDEVFDTLETRDFVSDYKSTIDKMWLSRKTEDLDYEDELTSSLNSLWIELTEDERVEATEYSRMIFGW